MLGPSLEPEANEEASGKSRVQYICSMEIILAQPQLSRNPYLGYMMMLAIIMMLKPSVDTVETVSTLLWC